MGEASDHCETTLSHERTWRTTVACLGPVGRFPKAPGTAGSLVAIPMAAYLLYALPLWALALTCLLLMLFAVRCCGKAEQEMGLRDPGCMVLDEWVAIPCCYLGLLWIDPAWQEAFQDSHWGWSIPTLKLHLAVFCLFRVFDIWKPWPVGLRSAGLEGGGWSWMTSWRPFMSMGSCVYLGECSSKPQGWKFYHGMRVLIQRVARASVMIEGHDTQMIQAGLVLLVGVEAEDGPEDVQWLTHKITQMRLFNDDEGKMNRSRWMWGRSSGRESIHPACQHSQRQSSFLHQGGTSRPGKTPLSAIGGLTRKGHRQSHLHGGFRRGHESRIDQ